MFVANPWLDYELIYDDAYYAGRGADPLVNYLEEISDFSTAVRRYEWRGICDRVASLVELDRQTEWLDYGCGAGGLVKYLNEAGFARAVGFEQQWAIPLKSFGIPVLDEAALAASEQRFDVVSAVEVLEHVYDPIAELRRLRALLKPGGLLFLTTGNPGPFVDRLTKWSYIVPEVHISFFEPGTLDGLYPKQASRRAFPGYRTGWTDIIRFRILKNLGRHRVSPLERLVPWSVMSRLADRRFEISAQPLGWAS